VRRLWPAGYAGWLLAALLLSALGLRLWSLRHGLPWVYNRDEEFHFVPVAVRMFGGSFNPGYFENPPALTYLLYAVFRLRFSAEGFRAAFAADPTAAYETARAVVAVIGTASVGFVYWAGTRWFERRVALLGAALIAFSFLPVFYGKFALNDAVTLAPLAIGLGLIALAWEQGRTWQWALAAAAIGVATAVKYTAGAMLLPLAIAAIVRSLDQRSVREAIWPVVRIGIVAGIAFAAAFLALNPYSLVEFSEFRSQVAGQSATAGGSAKLGQPDVPGWLYYLWTLTWGLGWAPAVAAIAGGILLVRENWRRGLVLVAFPLFMFLFLGGQARYFGRWFMPAYPAIVLLAGYAAVRASDALAARRPALGRWALPVLAVLLLAQGLASSIRSDSLLARADTREVARSYILEHVPPGSGMVLEPFVPRGWLAQPKRDGEERYRLYPVKPPFQAYTKNLSPALIDEYRSDGYCWVVVASHQKQRGLKGELPGAIGYYRRLNQESDGTRLFDPWREGADRPGFNFDMSFNYYPTAFTRPGPLIELHHLRGCRGR
jgi:hypothetical protein